MFEQSVVRRIEQHDVLNVGVSFVHPMLFDSPQQARQAYQRGECDIGLKAACSGHRYLSDFYI